MFQRRKGPTDEPTSSIQSAKTPTSPRSTSSGNAAARSQQAGIRETSPHRSHTTKTAASLSPLRRSEPTISSDESNKSNPALSEEEVTWKEAHRRTCLERKTLFASCEQVMELFSCFYDIPLSRNDIVVWNEDDSLKSAEAASRKLKEMSTHTSNASKSDSSSNPPERPSSWAKRLLAGAAKGASTLILGGDGDVFGNDDDDDEKVRQYDSIAAAPKEMIVNLGLANACLQALSAALRNQPARILLHNSSDSNLEPTVAERHSFETWCRQVAVQCKDPDARTLLTSLDLSNSRFLADLLVANNLAALAPDRQDRVILGGTGSSTPTEVDTMVTMFDLQINEESMSKNVEAWTARADACGRSALKARRDGRTRQAAMDLKRRQMLLQQVTNTQNALLQLEQIRNTLEHAQTHSQVVECLETTAQTLQTMRTDPKALHSLHADIGNAQAELENANALPSSLDGISDQELLSELEEFSDITQDDEEQLLLELNKLENLPLPTANTKLLVPANTGTTLTVPSTARTTLVSATTGMSTAKKITPSSNKSGNHHHHHLRKPNTKEADSEEKDQDILELERRLLALQAPPSKKKDDKKGPDQKTLAAVAF